MNRPARCLGRTSDRPDLRDLAKQAVLERPHLCNSHTQLAVESNFLVRPLRSLSPPRNLTREDERARLPTRQVSILYFHRPKPYVLHFVAQYYTTANSRAGLLDVGMLQQNVSRSPRLCIRGSILAMQSICLCSETQLCVLDNGHDAVKRNELAPHPFELEPASTHGTSRPPDLPIRSPSVQPIMVRSL